MAELNILLVEDDPIDVRSVKRALNGRFGSVELQTAWHGKEALALLGGNCAGNPPNLILLDLNMPVMNGFELLTALKADEQWRRIPAVVFTTSAEDHDVQQSYGLGAAGYLVKPLSSAEFTETMGDFLNYWERCELRC